MAKIAPLSTGLFVTSIVGFLVSALYIPQFSFNWAIAFGTAFIVMFVASIVSMIHGPPEQQLGLKRKH